MERVPGISSEEGESLDEGHVLRNKSPVIVDQILLPAKLRRLRTGTLYLALLSPVRVYKPLRDHLFSILIEIRFLSSRAPVRLQAVN